MLERRNLIAVGGLIASGKSTVAKELAKALEAHHLEADRVRDELLEIGSGQQAHEAAWKDNLAPGVTKRIYAELLARTRALRHAHGVILLDGCFARREQRLKARALARDAGRPFTFVECIVPRETLEARLRERGRSAHVAEEAWLDLLTGLEARWEPVVEMPPGEHVRIDCTKPLGDSVEIVLESLDARAEDPHDHR